MDKYSQGGTPLRLEPHGASSSTWKAIVQVNKHIGFRFKWRVGNGASSFWFDNWLNDQPFCQMVLLVHVSYSSLKVCNIWEGTS